MLVGLNSLRCFTSLRDSSSQQLLPTLLLSCCVPPSRKGSTTTWLVAIRCRGSDATRGLPDLTSPQGRCWVSALQHGLYIGLHRVLTQWNCSLLVRGTSESVIAKSCVEFKKKKTQFTHTGTGSYIQSMASCWCKSMQLMGVCCSDSWLRFPRDLAVK